MASRLDPQLREQIENTIRFLAADAVEAANSGHPGAPMGLARAAFELWNAHLRFDPGDPQWPLRDRFVLSAGHASMLLYSLLHLFGYDLPLDEIKRFRQLGSRTPGHPEYGHTPGVEVTTGPLGQGFAHAVGMALAGRAARARFGAAGEGPGGHLVYGICSDGDLMEGVSAEAASLAGHLGLGNLIFLYDDNRVTIDGPTSLSFSEDVGARFEAYHWHVQHADGQDVEGIRAALEAARAETGRPSLVVLRTTIGYGSPNKAGSSSTHGSPLGAEEIALAKQRVGWPQESFLVPAPVRAYLERRAQEKRDERRALDAAFAQWRTAHPDRAAAWDAARARALPEGLDQLLLEGMEGVSDATRKHSAAVLERISRHVPYLLGGSADLAGSAAPPLVKGAGVVGPTAEKGRDPFAGQNLHFGVREHAMGGVANGINLDGTFIGYCGTFLIFSDYMRASIRLAALMKQRTIYVFTHDSIFLGEDGPTHQPIEQLDSLRAIPGLTLFRPADGVETAMAYAWILERASGPCALALSRQKLPALKRDSSFEARQVWNGAYVVSDAQGRPDLVLVATGSEVGLACGAAELLRAEGRAVRVVSAPCPELFFEQSVERQTALIPDDGTPIVAVEAGRGQSLWRLVGRRGLVYGMRGFGASAPWQELAVHFGFTPDALAARVREFLQSR